MTYFLTSITMPDAQISNMRHVWRKCIKQTWWWWWRSMKQRELLMVSDNRQTFPYQGVWRGEPWKSPTGCYLPSSLPEKPSVHSPHLLDNSVRSPSPCGGQRRRPHRCGWSLAAASLRRLSPSPLDRWEQSGWLAGCNRKTWCRPLSAVRRTAPFNFIRVSRVLSSLS